MYGDSMGALSVNYMEEGRRDRSVWTWNGKALFSGITCMGIPYELCLLTTWRRGGQTGVSGHGMVRFIFWYHMYGDSMGALSVNYMEEGRTDRSVWTWNGKALFSGITCTGIPWELCLLTTWRRDRSVWTRNGKALFSGITCTGIPWELCLLTTWRRRGQTGVSGHGMVRLYFLVSHVRRFHGSSVC